MNAQTPLAVRTAVPLANPLATRAMLSGLRLTMWTARKLDKGATADVHTANGAAADAGRYNKALIAKDALAGIVTAANAARAAHYARTLPWLDDGARILPALAFDPYTAEMRRLRVDFETAVATFVDAYPAFVAAAQSRLGKLYNPADYPAASEIRDRFTFAVRVLPMPDARDFRVELADSQAADVRAAIEASTREALETAMADAWRRITETVGRMAEKLRGYKPATMTDKAEGVFRDSLVQNVRDLVGVLPSFNLTADPVLADIIARMERDLCGEDAAVLRDEDEIRAETARAAESILADVSAYLA